MVESTDQAGFKPDENEQALILQYLGSEAIVDEKFKTTQTLSKEQAEKREELVQEIEYDFQLALNKGDYYLGNAVINFYLKGAPNNGELFLDLQAMAIAELQINEQKFPGKDQFQGQKIALEQPHVNIGWNTVTLRYINPYNKNQIGLHTFTDSKDSQQYLYSQFEAFHCHRVFPCFDQPGLKAKMTLTLTCPKDWQAVSNGIETRYDWDDKSNNGVHVVERNNIEYFIDFYDKETQIAVCDFEQTPKISPYLYAVCAGPYRVFEDFDPMHVPQRVFVRQSLVENMRHELVFGITKTTIAFYQKSFGQRYPFSKIDHVMSPDYKYGAMENVGCITYSDDIMCSQKEMSVPQLTFFAVVIQHELCHMWFGNLVTMQWWNDLWLNEAFATALSYKACSEGGDFVNEFKEEAWLHMSGYKRWGLGDDLMPSNHKIQADCPSTDMAESLIDGITYGKGSSLIKQLIFLMDWEPFCAGLRIYFKRHKWGNTTLPDFLQAMQIGYDESKPTEPLDLDQWGKDWLQTKGVNKMSSEYEQADGKFTKFQIRQTPCKHADNKFRKQTINIAFYNDEGGLVEKIERVNVENKELTELEFLKGKQVPAGILLNSDDWGFGHFLLTDESIKLFEDKLSKVQNKVDRAVVIGQLICMMRQIEYPATRFPTVMNQLMEEKNQNLINALFGAFSMAMSSYLPIETVPKFKKETADFFLKKAKKENDNKDLQSFCIDKALTFISQQDNLKVAADWILNGKVTVEGADLSCELKNTQKYDICKKYWASGDFSLDEKKALRAKVFENDDSDAGKNVQKVLEWSLPDEALKARLWDEITDSASTDSLMEVRLKVQGFWQRHQQLDLMTPYFEKYYATVQKIVEQRDREFAEVFINGLSPAFMAREQDESAFKELLSRTSDDSHFFTLFLKKQIETIDIIKKSRHLCETFRLD